MVKEQNKSKAIQTNKRRAKLRLQQLRETLTAIERDHGVRLDLTTFKYVPISQAAEIPNKVKIEIVAILRDTGAPIS